MLKDCFISREKEFLNGLARVLISYNVKIKLYLRRQDLIIESLYAEHVKTRDTFSLSFKEFFVSI